MVIDKLSCKKECCVTVYKVMQNTDFCMKSVFAWMKAVWMIAETNT